jgi:ferrochelatase
VLQLGTPDEPTVPAVRRYLKEFLLDHRVIDLPWAARQALVRGVILPTRPARSAAAYQKVWDADRGSPLRFYTEDLVAGVQQQLGDDFVVAYAMRYGSPSTAQVLKQMGPVDDLLVVPMYPQYATASTESALDAARAALAGATFPWTVVQSFAELPALIDAVATLAEPVVQTGPDHVLFSYHGLPERQLMKALPHGKSCVVGACCDRIPTPLCYRAQCFATTRAVAAKLGLRDDQWSVSFQSRLGRAKWLDPNTVTRIEELVDGGVKHLVVLCPSFVADCLETLEEISMEARSDFMERGGERFDYVPCVNASPVWVEGFADFLRQRALR